MGTSIENRGCLPPEKYESKKSVGYQETPICFLSTGTETLNSGFETTDADKQAIDFIKTKIQNRKTNKVLDGYVIKKKSVEPVEIKRRKIKIDWFDAVMYICMILEIIAAVRL